MGTQVRHRDSKGHSVNVWSFWYVVTLRCFVYSSLPRVSVDLTPESFRSQVLSGQDHWVLDFYAPWCGPCQHFAPEFEVLARVSHLFLFLKSHRPVQNEPDSSSSYKMWYETHFDIFFEKYPSCDWQILKGEVRAGKLDCQAHQQICQSAGITAYPTVRFYPYLGMRRVRTDTLRQTPTFSRWSLNSSFIPVVLALNKPYTSWYSTSLL